MLFSEYNCSSFCSSSLKIHVLGTNPINDMLLYICNINILGTQPQLNYKNKNQIKSNSIHHITIKYHGSMTCLSPVLSTGHLIPKIFVYCRVGDAVVTSPAINHTHNSSSIVSDPSNHKLVWNHSTTPINNRIYGMLATNVIYAKLKVFCIYTEADVT